MHSNISTKNVDTNMILVFSSFLTPWHDGGILWKIIFFDLHDWLIWSCQKRWRICEIVPFVDHWCCSSAFTHKLLQLSWQIVWQGLQDRKLHQQCMTTGPTFKLCFLWMETHSSRSLVFIRPPWPLISDIKCASFIQKIYCITKYSLNEWGLRLLQNCNHSFSFVASDHNFRRQCCHSWTPPLALTLAYLLHCCSAMPLFASLALAWERCS